MSVCLIGGIDKPQDAAHHCGRERPSSLLMYFPQTEVLMDIHGVAPLLQVFDMPTAIHFYRDVLGFAVWGSSEAGDNCDWCGLRLNGVEVMLNTIYEADDRPASPHPTRIGHNDICLFFGCKDLDAGIITCARTA